MNFSLKRLLGFVAICAIVIWCNAQVGFSSQVFWGVVAVSTAVSAIFVCAAQDIKLRRLAPLVPIPILMCCWWPITSLALLVNGLLLFVVGVFCAFRHPLPAGTLCVIAMMCALLALVAGVVPGMLEVRRLNSLRQEFPLVSLEPRLAYEKRDRRRETSSPVTLNASVSARLQDWDDNMNLYKHIKLKLDLNLIHDRQYEGYVRGIGFSIDRRPRTEQLLQQRRPLRNVTFAETIVESDSVRNAWISYSEKRSSNDVEQLHVISQSDFVNPAFWGVFVEPKHQVVGYVEHGFQYSPLIGLKDHNALIIERLELVSLLKFDAPRVYVLDHLPRMDQLSSDDVPTRPLDAFESDALQMLYTAEDIVVSQQGRAYRMLGSLRAAKQCLECHNVRRGELLGAFSYELRRDGKLDLETLNRGKLQR